MMAAWVVKRRTEPTGFTDSTGRGVRKREASRMTSWVLASATRKV